MRSCRFSVNKCDPRLTRNVALLLSLLFLFATSYAQHSIRIDTAGLSINNKLIPNPMKLKYFTGVFGEYDRTYDGKYTIYIYNNIGARLYQTPGGNRINSFYLDLVRSNFKFSPSHTFQGEIEINGYKISESFNESHLKEIPQLFFDKDRPVLAGYQAVTFKNLLILFQFDETGKLYTLAFSFSADRNHFSKRQ